MALIHCPECGKEISSTSRTCLNCGYKLVKNSFITKRMIYFITLILTVIILIFVTFIGLYKIGIFKTADEYLKEGNYISAYKKARGDKKDLIYKENQLAYICKDIVNDLKDPSSFKLRNVYYDEDDKKIVFEIGAKNSYGASVVNYWYYTYNEDKHEYTLYTTFSSLEKQTIYKYADSSSEKMEKTLKNLVLDYVKEIMSNSTNKVEESIIKNINYLFEKELLNNVTLIQENEKYI